MISPAELSLCEAAEHIRSRGPSSPLLAHLTLHVRSTRVRAMDVSFVLRRGARGPAPRQHEGDPRGLRRPAPLRRRAGRDGGGAAPARPAAASGAGGQSWRREPAMSPAPVPREARRDLAGRALPLARRRSTSAPVRSPPARSPPPALSGSGASVAARLVFGTLGRGMVHLPAAANGFLDGVLNSDMDSQRICFEQGKALIYMSGQQGHHREGARRRRGAPPNLRCRSHPHLAGRAGRPPPQGRSGRPRVSVHPANLQVDVAVARLTVVIGAGGAGENTWRRANRRALPTHFYDADSIDQGLGSYECRYCSSEAATMFVCQPVTSSGRGT